MYTYVCVNTKLCQESNFRQTTDGQCGFAYGPPTGMYVCMYVCTCILVHINMCVCVYVYMYTYVCEHKTLSGI